MTEETSSRIRPVWLIGGGIGLAVLGICALISLAVAAGLIWLTSNMSSNAVPTSAVVRPTSSPAALTQAAPTALPSAGAVVITLVPVASAPPTAAVVPNSDRLPPDQAVRIYFQLVSQGRYDLTWPMLTDAFKQRFNCCAPNYNYSGYLSWWDSVNTVDFGSVRTVSQDANRAVVYAELFYNMNDGRRSASDNNPYIELVYDSAMGSWRFNDKRAAP